MEKNTFLMMVEPKLLRLVFVGACSMLYQATLNVKMKFDSIPIEQDRNKSILLKTRRVVSV